MVALILAGTTVGLCAQESVPAESSALPSPEKSYWIPAGEIIAFDLLLSNFNRATSGSKDYEVSWKTIGRNLRGPWVTDNDPFKINQLAHPFQGSLYHAAGRSMGMGYWESSALTFAGSAWWEITGERTRPSINDQVASGIAGSFFGEPLFRMAHLVGDHGNLSPAWRSWITAAISPPVALNRFAFGDKRYGAVFDDHDPDYYSRLQIGATRAVQQEHDPSSRTHPNAADVDFYLVYGLPGNAGYSYTRPFDYFDFHGVLSSANGVENLITDGLLLGGRYEIGPDFRAIAGVYGGYEYLSPQLFHVSTTSVSIGTTAQWWVARRIALQGSLLGGVGYAAVSSTVRDINSSQYHYGGAPRIAATLRVIDANRVSLDVNGRYLSVGRIASRSIGRDSISRVETALTWRVVGRHAISMGYTWSHRSATFASGDVRGQTIGLIGISYTLLGRQDFGMVDWRTQGAN